MVTKEPRGGSDPDILLMAIQDLNDVIQRQVDNQRNWKRALRNEIVAGLGGVLGATIVVSVLVYFLQPQKRIEAFSSAIDRLNDTLKRTGK